MELFNRVVFKNTDTEIIYFLLKKERDVFFRILTSLSYE